MTDGLNDNLIDGSELKGRADWSGVVIGNGFSQKLWRSFGYQAISQLGRAICSPMVPTTLILARNSNISRFKRLAYPVKDSR